MNDRNMLQYVANSKSGVMAALLNVLMPGLGFLYVGNLVTAIVVGTSFTVLFLNFVWLIEARPFFFVANPDWADLLGFGIAAAYLFFFITGFGAAERHNQLVARDLVNGA